MRFTIAVLTAAWAAVKFFDTDNGIWLGLCVAAGLIAIAVEVEDAREKIVQTLKGE